LVAALVAMIIAILSGPTFIAFLRRKEFGQQIRDVMPERHFAKQGTPTMGGLMIVAAASIAFLALSTFTLPALTVFGTTLACGGIGFLDDYIKLHHKRSLGLRGRWKILMLIGVTAAVGLAASHQGLSHSVFIPIVDKSLPLGPFWFVLLFLIIGGSVNGVNLTDGLDGLAAGTVIIALATFTAMAVTIYIRSSTPTHGRIENRLDMAFIGAALIGGAIGFLWFNAFPAELFMGDTGAMALGGALATMAIMMEGRVVAAVRRRHLRHRGDLGDTAGHLVQVLGPADLPNCTAPLSLRDEGVVGDEDHGALLDHHRAALRRRLRPLLQVLPALPGAQLKALVYGAARSGPRRGRAARRRRARRPHAGNEDDVTLLDDVDVLVKSPGVPADALLVAVARDRGIPVWSEVELGYRLLAAQGAKLVGVTGTNGKTTTTELLGAIFRAAGRDVAVAGTSGRR
jgi:phospho-N-acetylmuramoyl-pentapeptide-transferase